MGNRIENLINLLPPKIDGALIMSEENRLYFTGFASSDGFLVVSKNSSVFYTDSRYIEAAKKAITACEVRECTDFMSHMQELISELKLKTVAIEAEKMTVGELKRVKEKLDMLCIDDSGDLDNYIDELRSVKQKEEINCIKKAQEISELAFKHILEYIILGKTEKDICVELDSFMKLNGAQDVSFDTIIVSGKNSSMPHGTPSEKKIERGDFITMDFGAVWQGYHSDMTRTVALGEVNSYQEEIYNIVLKAQEESLNVLREGVSCKEADEAARKIIRDAGYGKYFGHGTGHGVGVEIHEKPNLSPRSSSVLKSGNVVTVEPGIYLPGKFGVRIEDMAVITERGCENLTKAEKKLLVI